MDQADRLRTLTSRGNSENATRIVSVTSGKGGVGKTNIAVSLALLYARKGLSVLLIDADLGLANANIILNCRIGKTIDDVMFENIPLKDVFVKTQYGFDLLPSSSGYRQILDMDAFEQRTLFDQLFKEMGRYDVVIYDTAPGLGEHVLGFNSTAHDIVVVAHPEPTALADAYALIKVLHLERREKKFKLLINRARTLEEGLDSYKKLTEVSDEFLNISIDFLGSLPEDLSVLRSVRLQRPVAFEAPRAPFTIGLDRVADKLLAGGFSKSALNMWDTRSFSLGSARGNLT